MRLPGLNPSPAQLASLVALSLLVACKNSPSRPQEKRQEPAPAPSAPSKAALPSKSQGSSKTKGRVKVALHPLDQDKDGSWDLLAVDWSIEPGWHIYWTNPGDSGLATEVEFDAESAEHFHEVQLPAPEKFFSAGELIGYGYHDQSSFFAKRKDPNRKIDAPIHAKLTWLVCKEACLRGSTKLSLDPKAAPQSWSSTQRKAYARLPKAASELKAKTRWSAGPASGKTANLSVEQGELLEFFPLESKAKLKKIELSENELRLAYEKPAALGNSKSAHGVLGIKKDEQTSYYEVQLPTP